MISTLTPQSSDFDRAEVSNRRFIFPESDEIACSKHTTMLTMTLETEQDLEGQLSNQKGSMEELANRTQQLVDENEQASNVYAKVHVLPECFRVVGQGCVNG